MGAPFRSTARERHVRPIAPETLAEILGDPAAIRPGARHLKADDYDDDIDLLRHLVRSWWFWFALGALVALAAML